MKDWIRNLEKCLDEMRKEDVRDQEDLLERLKVIPSGYAKIFKAKWGLDESQEPCESFKDLAKKLNLDLKRVEESYWHSIELIKLAPKAMQITGSKELSFRGAVSVGIIAEKIKDGKTKAISGKKLMKAIRNTAILDEYERTVMTRRTRAHPVSYEGIAEELGISERAVMVIEENAINSLRVEYFKGNL